MMPWNDKHWTVDPKVPKELRTFDGDIRHYDKWRLRVRYHFISTNIFYQNIFDLIIGVNHADGAAVGHDGFD